MKVWKNSFKYLKFIPFVLLGLTPILWFWGKSDLIINGIDTNFPLNPEVWFLRRLFVWNNVTNGGIDFSSSTAGLFFHFVQYLPYKLGFNLQVVQISSLLFWFFAIVFTSWFLAKVLFVRSYWVQLLFVVLYNFNIYVFNTWENVKVANLSLISATPLALATLILLKNQKVGYPSATLYLLFSAVLLSGAGINPAYFATFFFILIIYVLGEVITEFNVQNIKARIKDFLFISLVIIGINAFWILPTVNFILTNVAPSGSIDKAGFTNWVDSLSENTSILNVTRLQGAWDWYAFDSVSGLPLYIPYALNYFHRLPFLAFSFFLPALVLLSLVLRNNRRGLYLAFALMFIIGIFLGAGTHAPTGDVFRWISDNLPFFTLFRSPWYIFTLLMVLSTAGLVSLLFGNLLLRRKTYYWRASIIFAVILTAIGNLVYSYPLVTGKIFRPKSTDTFYVDFPQYVLDSAQWLNNQETGRVLGYPDDEIEKFEWKYRGIESILQLAAGKEVLFSPLNAPDAPIAKLIKAAYGYLKKGELESAKSIVRKLNASVLFEKNDQESLSDPLPVLAKREKLASFGEWNFYKFPGETAPKVYSSNALFYGYPHTNNPQMLSLFDNNALLVNPHDSVVSKFSGIDQMAGSIILTDNSQAKEFISFTNSPSTLKNRLFKRDPSRVFYSFNVFEEGQYNLYLERYGLESFGLGGQELEVEVDGDIRTLQVIKRDDSYFQLESLSLTQGNHIVSFGVFNPNLISGGDFQGEIGFEEGGYGVGDGKFRIIEEGQEKYLSILNIDKADVSADFRVEPFDPNSSYYAEFRYKQIFGNNANVIVLQGNDKTLVKAQTERLPNHPEWNSFSFFYQPVRTKSRVKIALSAPHVTDPLGTKVFYDDFKVFKVFTNDLILVRMGQEATLAKVDIKYNVASPVKYTGTVSKAGGAHIISFAENYSPEWGFLVKNGNAKIAHFSSDMYANSWYVEESPEKYEFEIYYTPQNYFYLGVGISLVTLALIFLNVRRKHD